MKKTILITFIFLTFLGAAGFAKAAAGDSCWSAEKLETIKCPLVQGNCDLPKEICQRHCGTWLRIGLPGFIQNCVPNGVPPIDENDLTKGYDFSHSGFMVIFNGIYELGLTLLAITTLFMIVWGGYQYLTAMGGNRASEGKKIIYYAIGGMILGLSSWLILNVINDQLTKGYSNPLRFQSEIDRAKRAIENKAAQDALRCGAGSDAVCSGKNPGDLCKKDAASTAPDGTCQTDPNVGQNICSCVTDYCLDSTCHNKDPDCPGHPCTIGVDYGQCVDINGTVSCVNATMICANNCDTSEFNVYSLMNCYGYSCKKNPTDAAEGICLGPSGGDCLSPEQYCTEYQCGANVSGDLATTVVASCKGRPCLADGFLGTCSMDGNGECYVECNDPQVEGLSCVFTDGRGGRQIGYCQRPDPNNSLLECLP